MTLTSEIRALPWWARLLLIRPRQIGENLQKVRDSGLVATVPNLWQVTLGVARMWHRIVFRFNSIGTCADHPVRPTWRARLLHWRPARFIPLLWEGAISPWDMTGLLSSRERMTRHLLGAHHDGDQFVYDLQILACYPGALDDVMQRAQRVLSVDDRRSRWLQDLCVHERYHDNLLASVKRAIAGDFGVPAGQANDPDITFTAWLQWCCNQPSTPEQTRTLWRNGGWSLGDGARSLPMEGI